jgi:hypothetical protein
MGVGFVWTGEPVLLLALEELQKVSEAQTFLLF